jgi:hypothetical protein
MEFSLKMEFNFKFFYSLIFFVIISCWSKETMSAQHVEKIADQLRLAAELAPSHDIDGFVIQCKLENNSSKDISFFLIPSLNFEISISTKGERKNLRKILLRKTKIGKESIVLLKAKKSQSFDLHVRKSEFL